MSLKIALYHSSAPSTVMPAFRVSWFHENESSSPTWNNRNATFLLAWTLNLRPLETEQKGARNRMDSLYAKGRTSVNMWCRDARHGVFSLTRLAQRSIVPLRVLERLRFSKRWRGCALESAGEAALLKAHNAEISIVLVYSEAGQNWCDIWIVMSNGDSLQCLSVKMPSVLYYHMQ